MKDPPTTLSAMELYKRVVILLKNDNVDVQEIAVTALGASNPDVFRYVSFFPVVPADYRQIWSK